MTDPEIPAEPPAGTTVLDRHGQPLVGAQSGPAVYWVRPGSVGGWTWAAAWRRYGPLIVTAPLAA